MKYLLNIWRQKAAAEKGHFQEYVYETEDEKMTLARALLELNRLHPEDEIVFEHSCHQKKCGACAMVIQGRPSLACDAVLKQRAKKGRLQVEPLRKFPVIADLMVDRSILFENLKIMKVWAEEGVRIQDKALGTVHEASGCLQCGCCLEVCPNFYPGGNFFGTAALVPSARLISSMTNEDGKALRQAYKTHIYNGCGKSLACHEICPAHIDMDHLLSRSNAISIWRRR